EIYKIKKAYRKPITFLQIKTALQTLRKGYYIGKAVKKIIYTYSIETDSRYLYSYWTNDMAFVNAYISSQILVQALFSRAHGWDVYFEVNDSQYLPYRKYILHNSQGILFISQRGKEYYNQLFSELQKKIRISYLGVSLQQKSECRLNSFKRVVSCSNIIPIKQVHVIIQALSKIEYAQIEWIHFGDGPLFEEIRELSSRFLLNKSNITFRLAGRVSNTKVIEYYSHNQVDCLLNVSLSEGIPVSMMEAMSFGIPVIGTNVGGVSEIIEHEKNGFLLSPTPSKEEVAAAIERFCSLSLDDVQTMRANAYNTWNTKFNAQKNYKAFIEQICNL
ncbi:MAG TPA: glycosyltransferase, partial [Bacteroidales bacterium]|nr:glycosyltransferase [Bacteroidales bacterium]